MIARVLSQEWLLIRSSAGLLTALLLLLGVTALAAVAGNMRVGAEAETAAAKAQAAGQTRESVSASLRRWEASGQPAPAPAVAMPGALGLAILEVPLALPPTQLAALAANEGDPAARSLLVTAHAAYRLESAGMLWNPVNLAAGHFDVVFVVVLFLPIVIIALSFDMLSREKERGTLALVISQGVSLRSFVMARVLSRGLLVLAVMCIATVTVLIAVAGMAALWPAGMALLLATCLYGCFWFALALLVNALGFDSNQNAVILAGSWLLLVLIIPALVNLLAATLYPAPSRVLLTTEIRAAAADAEQRAALAREDFLYDHPELTGGAEAQEAYFRQVLETDARVAASIAPLQSEFAQQAQRRDVLVARLGLVSPALLTRQSLLRIAGADAGRQRAWRDAVDIFHAEWSAFIAMHIRAGAPVGSRDIDNLPEFSFAERTQPWQLANATAVLAMTLVLLALAMARLRRYVVKI